MQLVQACHPPLHDYQLFAPMLDGWVLVFFLSATVLQLDLPLQMALLAWVLAFLIRSAPVLNPLPLCRRHIPAGSKLRNAFSIHVCAMLAQLHPENSKQTIASIRTYL